MNAALARQINIAIDEALSDFITEIPVMVRADIWAGITAGYDMAGKITATQRDLASMTRICNTQQVQDCVNAALHKLQPLLEDANYDRCRVMLSIAVQAGIGLRLQANQGIPQ